MDCTKPCEVVLAAINLLQAADGCTYGPIKRTAELLRMALRVISYIEACMQALKDISRDNCWHKVSPKILVVPADAYRFQGCYRDAKKFPGRTGKVLPLQDINVLLYMNHLARACKLQGKHDRTARMFEEKVKVLGFDDSDTQRRGLQSPSSLSGGRRIVEPITAGESYRRR